MIKVSDVVLDSIKQDPAAYEAIQRGFLNFSAYASQIHSKVERQALKPVQLGTIVVALSRLSKQSETIPPTAIEVHINTLNISSPLRDISFEKSLQLQKSLSRFLSETRPDSRFIAITSGISEITIICAEEYADSVLQVSPQPPKAMMSNLAAITVSFSDSYLSIPNTIYSLLAPLAAQSINIVEIVSTYTELSIVIAQDELDTAISCLMPFMHQQTQISTKNDKQF